MTPPVTYHRSLGLFSGTMAVVGGIIGSGIFINPSIVAQRVGTPALTLGVWGLGGIIALIGACCFGELGQRRPRAGGSYVYIREALGPLPAFLYAWALLLVMATGAIAAVAVTFARYALGLAGLDAEYATPLAAAAILILSAVNYIGIRPGASTTNAFTLLKLAALAFLIVAGLTAGAATPTAEVSALHRPANSLLAVAAALVPVLFAYGGVAADQFHRRGNRGAATDYQTMAADGLFFPGFARLHPRFRTPAMAIMVQAIWAGALLATGRYGALLDYVVFCDWIFFGLAVISLFAIRRHDRETGVSAPPDAFQVPGWPFAPLLFVAAAIYVVMGSISSNPRNALLGLGILLLGVPVFHYWRRRSRVEGRESRLESQATIDS